MEPAKEVALASGLPQRSRSVRLSEKRGQQEDGPPDLPLKKRLRSFTRVQEKNHSATQSCAQIPIEKNNKKAAMCPTLKLTQTHQNAIFASPPPQASLARPVRSTHRSAPTESGDRMSLEAKTHQQPRLSHTYVLTESVANHTLRTWKATIIRGYHDQLIVCFQNAHHTTPLCQEKATSITEYKRVATNGVESLHTTHHTGAESCIPPKNEVIDRKGVAVRAVPAGFSSTHSATMATEGLAFSDRNIAQEKGCHIGYRNFEKSQEETAELIASVRTTSDQESDEQAPPVLHSKVTRPKCLEQPRVWAKRRQGLCDTLPYFRAHQGSLYTTQLVPLGLLIAKEARNRDHFDGHVVITTVGGGRVRDLETGQMIRVEDQGENRALRCFRTCKQESLPIVIIADDGHPHYPVEPPHPYCVLDYFHVTDIWPEQQVYPGHGASRVWCVRLEKIHLDKTSWWDPTLAPMNSDDIEQRGSCESQQCGKCMRSSKTIFAQGWSCLNHDCENFLMFDGKDSDCQSLQYTAEFIGERTAFPGHLPLPDLVPPLPSLQDLNNSHGSQKAFRVGIACPRCGCCSSRRSWAAWECENCDFTLVAPLHPYPQTLLDQDTQGFDALVERSQKKNGISSQSLAMRSDPRCITQRGFRIGAYAVEQYLLPGEEGDIAGSVTLLRANKRICSVLNGPDQLFSELCTKDIGLRRNPVTRQGNKSEVWTRHFAQNWGAPYKFGVAVQSKSFDEAPPAILKALHRMLWGGNAAASSASEWIKNLSQVDPVPNRDVVFNELLSLGYMQDDRISYHDDGEKQLGPTVATLSLGSPAVMSFRPKRKAKIQTTYGKKGPKGDFVEVLVLPLYHGDLVVMHGTRIHRLYDHKVDPHGGRRFALTCRYIDPSSLNSKEEKEAATMNGQIPAEAFNSYRYLGDEVEADEPLSGKCQNAVSNALTRPT